MEAVATPVELPGPRLPFEAPSKYQCLRVLGSGGMGTVLLARDRHLGRLVALKLLRDPGPWFFERFRREARVLARLAHPSIVAVHEFDLFAGRAYLALDYVDGGSLARARLEPRVLVRALRGVVDALEHAHRLGVVHRDVKPENVLLDRHGRAFLCDFGVAQEGDGRRAGTAVGGTPLTMSPEQARGQRVGPASDLFSLGVTLYRQLTGAWPFRGRTLADVLFAIQHEDPPAPRALAPELPAALERIVLRCLAKEPEQRFRSMAELGGELDRLLAHRSLLARLFSPFAGRTRRADSPRPRHRIHPEDLP
jgi:serine/threonine-protein kinase